MGNPLIYKISGVERRKMKKELNDLKRIIYYWAYCDDLNMVYGTGMAEEESQRKLDNIIKEKEELEKKLIQKQNE